MRSASPSENAFLSFEFLTQENGKEFGMSTQIQLRYIIQLRIPQNVPDSRWGQKGPCTILQVKWAERENQGIRIA